MMGRENTEWCQIHCLDQARLEEARLVLHAMGEAACWARYQFWLFRAVVWKVESSV